ncbi:MAG: type IVB secretion system protein IcmV [Proteobacteria bacterium]|nr:type IVB secretion system protein IcmV [Pseudomonadota bacterium]
MGIFKKIGGRIVDVRVDKWMSWDYLGETAERFKFLFMDIVIPKKANTAETFEEAMHRLDLTEEDIQQRKIEFTRLCYFFIVLSILIVLYALYMAYERNMATSLIAFCLSLYSLTQAFRFHFWLFQLRNRKLGCTIKEWMNSEIMQTPSKDLTVKGKSDVSSHDSNKKAK